MRASTIAAGLAALLVAASPAAAKPGDLYVGVPSGGGPGIGTIIRVNPDTGVQHVVASGDPLMAPDGGDFTKGGKLLISDYDADAVFKVNVKTGNVGPLAVGAPFAGPTDVTVGPHGSVYAADPFAGANGRGAIFRVAGGNAHLVSDGQFFNGGPLGLDFANHRIYAEDQDAGPGGSGALISIKPSTGHQHVVSSGHHLSEPYGMTLSPDNKFAYLSEEENNSVVRVKLSSGRQHVVASGGKIDGPTGLAVGLDGMIYVTNDNSAAILRVNPKSGHVAYVSEAGDLVPAGEGITVQPR
jgi:sugar lactone lactonase YvrE